MNKKLIIGLSGLIAGFSYGFEFKDINIHGGLSAGYYYADPSSEGFEVTNFLVELSKNPEIDDIGFTAAFGYLPENADTFSSSMKPDDFRLQYGYISLLPVNDINIEAGFLPSNVGYEGIVTYLNPHITPPRLAFAQPFYYKGARLNYNYTENLKIFFDVNDYGKDGAWNIGFTNHPDESLSYMISYFNYNNPSEPDILDTVVKYKLTENLNVGSDVDFRIGKSDLGYAFNFYFEPNYGRISLPVRAGVFDDNGNGAFNNNKGFEFTITPTYKLKSGYVRAEAFYYNYDNLNGLHWSPINRRYVDDSDVVLRVEAGMVF